MAAMAAAVLGMSVPLAAGVWAGNVQAGMLAALGSLSLYAEGGGGRRIMGFFYTIIAGTFGMWAGSILASGDMCRFGIPLLAGAAALFGNMSFSMARSSVLFVLFMIIASGLPIGGGHPGTLMVLFSVGAVWANGLLWIFTRMLRLLKRDTQSGARSKFPPGLLLKRWKWSLGYWAGWQYPLRIALCLLAAQTIDSLWAGHRGYWISLTVIIVVQRNMRGALKRTLERAAGTLIGVLLCSLLLIGAPPVWGMIAMIAVLSGLRPILLSVNYTAYAAVMTPLVIILLEFGGRVCLAVIVDRLAATLAGCAVSITIGYIGWSRLPPLPDFRRAMQERRLQGNGSV